MDLSIQGLVQMHANQMERAFQGIVKYILYYSKLDIGLVRISNVTDDTFHVTLEARATNTGPAKATVSQMTLDICGPAGMFGQISLPQMNIRASGTTVEVSNQLVQITDKAALQAFITSIMVQSEATLSLQNGQCSVKAFGIGPNPIVYEKNIPLKGMNGPQVTVIAVSSSASDISLTLGIENSSPMEISFGNCNFEIHDSKGLVFAELKGRLDIRKGVFEIKLQGTVDKRVSMKGVARLVGKRCPGAGWCHEAVKGINVELGGAKKLLVAVGQGSDQDSIKEEMKSGLKFWKKYTIR